MRIGSRRWYSVRTYVATLSLLCASAGVPWGLGIASTLEPGDELSTQEVLSSSGANMPPGDRHRHALAQCFIDAGQRFGVDPYLLLSIKYVETGNSLDPEITGRNKNGTIDMGLMQINSIWLKNTFIQAAGIKKNHLYDPCININVGAWILSQEIGRHGIHEGIGRYHSATPKFKNAYRAKVLAQYSRLAKRKAEAQAKKAVVASSDQ